MLKRTLALAAGIALTLSATLTQAADVLRVSAIPDEAPTELLRKFKPLGAYLEQQLGMKVEFVPVADYPAVVEALATPSLWSSANRMPSSPANSSPPTRR
jgi:phosphonate transport system substrate-binding protein